MISSVFVDRPRLAIVIAFVITIAGALALLQIPVAQFPDIVPPQVTVSANFPGASAEVVESSVAQPLEAQVVGVDKMLYMKSTSGNDGSYTLTVSFALGTNPDINTVNVNNRVQSALAQLPTEVQAQGLTVQKRSSAVLQFIVLYSKNGEQDPLFITNYAIINVLDAISRTPGVGQATLFAKLNYSMRIWFDTQRLTSLNLAPSDVIAAIRAQSVQAPVGRIGARPISDDQQFQFNVQTQGRLTTSTQFGDIVLRANPDGSVLRIKDVARVEIGAQNMDSESRIDGQPGVPHGHLSCPRRKCGDDGESRAGDARSRLSERFPPGLTYLVQYDSTTFVTDTIKEVLKTLGEAFLLVVVVVFLFLGNLRATIIPAVAVPVSLIGAFAVLLVLGYSANTVSLLAMVLAIGIVVDDAIVVVENVERVMEEEPELSSGRGDEKGDVADHRADHSDHAGAVVGVRADRVHPGNLGNVVSPVRGHDQRGDGHLGAERADVVAGALCGVSASHRAAARHHGTRSRRHRLGSRWLCRHRPPYAAHGAVVACRGAGVRRRHFWRVAHHADRVSARRGSGRVLHLRCNCPTAASVARTSDVTKQVEDVTQADARNRTRALDHRLFAARWRQPAEFARSSSRE